MSERARLGNSPQGVATRDPLHDRNELLLAAGYAPAYTQTSLDDPTLDPIRGALERILEGHLPYPALITDRAGDLVSATDAFTVLIGRVPRSLREPRLNLPRILLHPDGLGPRVININEGGRHVIDGLARKAQQHPLAGLESLIHEIEDYVPVAPPLHRHQAPPQQGQPR